MHKKVHFVPRKMLISSLCISHEFPIKSIDFLQIHRRWPGPIVRTSIKNKIKFGAGVVVSPPNIFYFLIFFILTPRPAIVYAQFYFFLFFFLVCAVILCFVSNFYFFSFGKGCYQKRNK